MKIKKQVEKMLVKPGKKFSLKDHPTNYSFKGVAKKDAYELIQNGADAMAGMQDVLYSHNEYSILIIIQAMDAAGKDSIVKHVLSGLSPVGIRVTSFKAPGAEELDHDYLWRHNLALPARGEIGIFIRSHYENVLVTRVHPQYILNEKIPTIDSSKKIDKAFFKQRFRQINDWEKYLSENGTKLVKIFLHSSKDEQKKQLLERIDDPDKNWKFNPGDVDERAFWDKYMEAYEEMLNNTSTNHAPWYIVPADDRWFARISASTIIQNEFSKLKLSYPTVSDEGKEKLADCKKRLLEE